MPHQQSYMTRTTPLGAINAVSFERVYPIPSGDAFKTVSAAIAAVMWKLHGLDDPIRDSVEGGTKYTLYIDDDLIVQVFVLYTSAALATVQFHILTPLDRALVPAWFVHHRVHTPHLLQELAAFLRACDTHIRQHLHRAVALGAFHPPPPPEDIETLLIWQATYHPGMKDRQLAELAGMEVQSLRNARQRIDQELRRVMDRAKTRKK